jgi:hypothetical protein
LPLLFFAGDWGGGLRGMFRKRGIQLSSTVVFIRQLLKDGGLVTC